MSSHSRSPVLIDLFCGAGGLSEGLRQAGFIPAVGVDFDRNALSTYAQNHPASKPVLSDIRTVTGEQLMELAGTPDIDLVAGGPSCQGFSTHGKRVEDDPRNYLFKEFVRLVGEIRPKYFLMENVKGLLTYSKGHFQNLIETSFSAIGYRVASTTICAAHYGVPQMRHRIVFIGTRLEDGELSFPMPSHGAGVDGLLPLVTVSEAIGDLPLMGNAYKQETWSYASKPKSDFQRKARQKSAKTVSLHQARSLSVLAAGIAKFVGQGEGLRSVPFEHLPDRFKKMRRISNGELRRDCTTLYHRLHPHRPSYTITCNYSNIASGPFLHPREDRAISHREAARLMSFPDHFHFYGACYERQIGNAVPPLLASAIGQHIITLINRRSESRRAKLKIVA